MYNEDDGSITGNFFEGAGYYRVRINKVTYYLVTTKETKKEKFNTHDDQSPIYFGG
jgi:hypothetical protein